MEPGTMRVFFTIPPLPSKLQPLGSCHWVFSHQSCLPPDVIRVPDQLQLSRGNFP